MNRTNIFLSVITFALLTLCISCSERIGRSLFKGKTPHQLYQQQLIDAGLERSLIYQQWLDAANRSLARPIEVSVPHLERTYFLAENPEAAGYLFDARNGEKIQVQLALQNADSAQIFIDLYEYVADTSENHLHLLSAEEGDTTLVYDIKEDSRYLLRIQPEILSTISFELRITAEPSLGNPVAKEAKQHIGSFFGDGRDAGERKHEGIDIFADRATPAVAATDGFITRVGTNNLGGKIIFLKPKNRSINLYYAHLDSQLVSNGQAVSQGDTIGLVGNTGNARTTPPHLHFGIYAAGGAVDPLPFVRPGKSNPPKITASKNNLADTIRLTAEHSNVAVHTPAVVEAAFQNSYRVVLPDKQKILVAQNQVTNINRAIKTITLNPQTSNDRNAANIANERTHKTIIYSKPDTLSAQLVHIQETTKLPVIGDFKGFYLVEKDKIKGWIKQEGNQR